MRQNGCQRHVAWSLVVGMVFWGCNIVVARAADSGIDYQIQDDLTVIGSEGTLADPDVEVRGLSRFDKAIYTGDLLASPYGGLGRYENLLKYSEELTQTGSWTRTGLDATTPVAVDATGPTGVANSAVTLKNGAAANGTLAQVVTTTVTLPYTLSGWAKAGTSTTAQLELTTNGTGATTDTQALTLTSSWQRVSLTKSTGAGTSPTTLTATLKNTGAAGTTILLWGVQLEQAVSPGVYAKTTGSAMTAGRGLVATSGGLLFPDGSSQTTAVQTTSAFLPDTGGSLTTGLLSYWKLDEGGGTSVRDAVSVNDGTATNGPTWTTSGKLGKALSFDGTNDYVSLSPSSFPSGATPRTVSVWLKTATVADQLIFSYGTVANTQEWQLFVGTGTGCGVEGGGNALGTITLGTSGAGNGVCGVQTVTDNVWHHVVGVYDGTTIKIYIDGVLKNSGPRTSNLGLSYATIGGGYPNAPGYYFNGTIDEVSLWSKALSAAEITDLYNAGAGNAYRTSTAIGGWTDDGTVVRLSTGSDAVGIGTTSPAATALLDLTSTTKGLLAPRMTTTQRDAITSPAAGLLLYNTTTNAYNVYNGTSWGAVGGGSGDVLTTGTNTFTATTASPIKINPAAAPTADTKLLDMQATGAGTTNFSVDAEGDVLATSLDLTTPLPDAEVADNITASSYLPLAGGTLTGNLVIPNAGTLGQAAGPLLTFDDTNTELEITGGNVGIGTASPANLLEVAKNQAATTAMVIRNTNVSGYSQLSVLNDSGLGGGFGVGGSSTTTGVWGNRVYMATDSTSILGLSFIAGLSTGDIRLFTGGSATSNERMRIDSAGNVGIGTTSPAAKLHIAGGAAAVDAGQKLSLEGAASSGDTYATYEAVTGKLWLYVDGEQVAWLKN
ncbi:MAG: LamG domain-containing protein [Candidatus Omnitrophota bacterium]|nr:LamG domain-containing protein [Candidatus Omnitrophota bacterium]